MIKYITMYQLSPLFKPWLQRRFTVDRRMWKIKLGWTLVWENFGRNRTTFLDVRVFDKQAKRDEDKTLQQCYRTNEMEKKREYNVCILKVENWRSTQLVFPVNGGMGKQANKCYFRITEKLAKKRYEPYSVIMSWIRRKISFSMMKSIIMYIRGNRSIK